MKTFLNISSYCFRSVLVGLVLILALMGASAGSRVSLLDELEGASIVAADGHFLGIISANSYDPKSISNEFGDYGNEFSSDSIFNEFGDYGNEFSSYSPFNEFTSTPPKVFTKDEKWHI